MPDDQHTRDHDDADTTATVADDDQPTEIEQQLVLSIADARRKKPHRIGLEQRHEQERRDLQTSVRRAQAAVVDAMTEAAREGDLEAVQDAALGLAELRQLLTARE